MTHAPNVLLVVTDEQRPDMFGAAGRLPVQTPATDRLAEEGMVLNRAYAACPLCTPSRASILSGQYPSRHGVWTNGVPAPDDMLSLPTLLPDHRTALIGKSHLRPGHSQDVSHETRPARISDASELRFEGVRYNWDFFRSWDGPWYGFDYARLSTGHVYSDVAYSMHYAAWLDSQGIPCEPPYFMTLEQAREELGDVGLPGAFPRDEIARAGPYPPGTWRLPEEFHSSTWVANEVIAYLEDHSRVHGDRPFFVAANFPDPHPPFAVPSPWDEMYEGVELPPPMRRLGEWEDKNAFYRATIERRVLEMGWHDRFMSVSPTGLPAPTEARSPVEERWWRTYLGMQSLVDKHLGRILDTLDALGLAGSTLVIATSDHGDLMGDHFLWHKGALHYDGSARVPLIVRWPGRVPAGAQSSSLQSLVDLAPTIMRAAGLKPDPRMQGVDQLPVWTNRDASVREGVLIEHPVEARLKVESWITDRYRLSVHSDSVNAQTEVELYDLQEDPCELDTLGADPGRAGIVNELLGEVWRHRAELESPRPERITQA
jgi:arylsulfatase A-like enzyme